MHFFVDDDAGYRDWLSLNPDGFVLNTFAHVSANYLLLHRATCRTINRQLAPHRSWTAQYGKACAARRSELEEWVVAKVGKVAEPCGHCLGGARRSREESSAGHGGGPRAPRVRIAAIAMRGDPVSVRLAAGVDDERPVLVIEGAQWLAEFFFRYDASAGLAGSYDSWIAETQLDPVRRERIVDGDITAVNRTMAARTGHETWRPIVEGTDWGWLEQVNPDWDLFELTDNEWRSAGVGESLHATFKAVQRKRLQIAVATKVLHIKRPGLIPVLDSLVLQQVGSTATKDLTTWVRAVERVRDIGRANLASLHLVQQHLEGVGLGGRTTVRIFDALLWLSHPGSSLYRRLWQWEVALRPRPRATEKNSP